MSQPVNQHWVPQFYLKYFATQETKETKSPKAWLFSKHEEDGDPVLTNIKNICTKRYLYSPTGEEGRRNFELEEKLSGLESLLSSIWPVLAEGSADFEADYIRKGLSLFISVLHLRHPEQLDECVATHRHLVQLYEQGPKKPDGTPAIKAIEMNGEVYGCDTSGWEEYRDWQKNDHHLFFADHVQQHATALAEILMQKRWAIIFAEVPAFITSDKPVSKMHPHRETFGFGTEGTVVTFPISPTRLLVMDDNHQQPNGLYYRLPEEGPGMYNLGIWQNGGRFMISQRDVDEVLREIVACT